MTQKEKANELVDKFDNFDVLGEDHNGFTAQQCAMIAVDEIIEVLWKTNQNETEYRYWLDVKKEIENL
jgi:hypothetical protein